MRGQDRLSLQAMHVMGCARSKSLIVLVLQPDPESRGRPEAYCKSHRKRHGHRLFPFDEPIEFPYRNIERVCQISQGDRRVDRFHIDLSQHFPRMDRFFKQICHRSLLPYSGLFLSLYRSAAICNRESTLNRPRGNTRSTGRSVLLQPILVHVLERFLTNSPLQRYALLILA